MITLQTEFHVFSLLDSFTRRIFCVPMKNRKTESIINVFDELFNKTGVPCTLLVSDNEGGFASKSAAKFLQNIGIKQIFTKSRLHSYHAERAIGTLSKRLFKAMYAKNTERWTNLLPKVVKGYNDTKHRGLLNGKYSPNEIDNSNAFELEKYMRKNDDKIENVIPSFKIGDMVLISSNRETFEKGEICLISMWTLESNCVKNF